MRPTTHADRLERDRDDVRHRLRARDDAFAPRSTPARPLYGSRPVQYTQCDATGNDLWHRPLHLYHHTGYVDLSGTDPHISILVTNALENTGEGGYFDFRND